MIQDIFVHLLVLICECVVRVDVNNICLIRNVVLDGVQLLFANKFFVPCVQFHPKFQYVPSSIKSHCINRHANPPGGRRSVTHGWAEVRDRNNNCFVNCFEGRV
jgi:hypothetical protein